MAVVVNDRDLQLEALPTRILGVNMQPNIVVNQDNVEGLGLIVDGTKQIYISATSQVFQISKAGTVSPASITMTGNIRNITGTPTLTIAPGGGTMSVVPALTGGVFTFTESNMTTDTVTLRLSVTEGVTTYHDDFTFVKVREGSDGLTGYLTNESVTLPGDALGNITNYGGASGKFRVWQGANDVTTACTFAVTSGGNPDSLTFTATATGTNAGNYSVTGGWPIAKDTTSLTFSATFGASVIIKTFSLTRATSGQNGVAGANAATVYLFQRTSSSTPPALPTAPITYTFGTGLATGLTGGWTQSMPTAGGPYRWITTASALGTGTTDTIATTEWAPVASMGSDGLTTTLIYLYQRSATVPAVPSANVTFTFSTGIATGLTNGWAQTIPAGGNPIYVTTAVASSVDTTDTITPGEWATPVVLARNGFQGDRGSMTFYVALSGTLHVWSDTTATTAASVNGGPILNDIVTEYNNSQNYSETRFWSGTAWLVINAVVDGNLIVSGTIGTSALVANSVTATKIDSRGLTIKDAAGNVVFSSGSVPSNDTAANLGFNPTFSAWSSTYPDGWGAWAGAAPVKRTVDGLGNTPYSVQYTVNGAAQGAFLTYSWAQPLPAGTYLTGAFSAQVLVNNGGTGTPLYLVRLYTNAALTVYVDTLSPITNKAIGGWQNWSFVAGANGAAIYGITIYQMSAWAGAPGGSWSVGSSVTFGPFSFELRSPMTSANITTFMGNATIGTAQIDTVNANQINATSLSAITATIGTLRTATSGQRVEIQDNRIRVYDSSNVLRVKIGDLS
jgi:hypothetical protein